MPRAEGAEPAGAGTGAHHATVVAVLGLVVAVPLVTWANRHQWFYLDEWAILVDRSLTFDDVVREHNGHWVSSPVVAYRVLFRFVGLHHYWPYQALTVIAHVATAGLLLVVMRRAAVHAWVATTSTLVFAFLGAGRVNISWGFQVTFTGALALGLLAVVLADHDGERPRRDFAAVAVLVFGLTFSAIGAVMVGAVAVSASLRRGLRVGALLVGIPIVAYVSWYLVFGREAEGFGGDRSASRLFSFVASNVEGVAWAFGGPLPAVALTVAALSGLVVLVRQVGISLHRTQHAAPVGLACAGAAFLAITAWARSVATTGPADRYVYVVVALVLPLLALGLSGLTVRWPRGAPLVACVLMASALPGNIQRLWPDDPLGLGNRDLVLALAAVDLPSELPDGFEPLAQRWLEAEWLTVQRAAGRVPEPGDSRQRDRARLLVSFAPVYERAGSGCVSASAGRPVTVRAGQILRIGANPAKVRLATPSPGGDPHVRFGNQGFGKVFQPGPTGPEVRLLALADVGVVVNGSPVDPRVEVCERR